MPLIHMARHTGIPCWNDAYVFLRHDLRRGPINTLTCRTGARIIQTLSSLTA